MKIIYGVVPQPVLHVQNATTRCAICLKLTIKTPERGTTLEKSRGDLFHKKMLLNLYNIFFILIFN